MLLLIAVVLAGAILWRALASRRTERRTAARLPLGANGIIPGAAPIDLPTADARYGVLLLHGFGDTPQALAPLAHALSARGYGVLAPLLPGHGRTVRDFAASDADRWITAARSALTAMRGRYERVGLVGLSMGGALAAVVASGDAELPALILLAPYVDAPPVIRVLARLSPLVRIVTPYLSADDTRSIHDPVARARSLAYRATPPRLLGELVRLADRARDSLPGITAPTLIMQSRQDNRIAPAVAEHALRALGARTKRLEWLEGCGHVVTVDFCRERVAVCVGEWLEAFIDARGDSRQASAPQGERGIP
ncbi:MAG TPA: alpha/beta fold hydrolase [Gemmatimonadaceae bacterium]|nr:alpha/beta fold hydrolase [Gemmatimonadaceae bacterium]